MVEVKLHTEKLTVGYKHKTVVKDINLELKSGQLTCLLGPNGAGKSTLIRTISGVQKPIAGETYLSQKLIQDYHKKTLAKELSLVLTDRTAPGNLTAYALVSLGRFPYTSWMGQLTEEDKEIIHWALSSTGILEMADRHIGELSDGERQKVMIARALVQDTDVIILDEPTAHLDSPNRIEIFHLLRKLSTNTNKAILISTHDIDTAIMYSDQLWLINKGQIECGVPEDLILKGKLEVAFAEKELFFDYERGHFKKVLHKQTKSIALDGDPILVKWTKSALERAGYSIKRDAINEIKAIKGPPSKWMINDSDHSNSIENLLIKLIELEK